MHCEHAHCPESGHDDDGFEHVSSSQRKNCDARRHWELEQVSAWMDAAEVTIRCNRCNESRFLGPGTLTKVYL